MKVTIIMSSLNGVKKYIVDTNNLSISFNEQTIQLDLELIIKIFNRIKHITSDWQESYIDNSIMDGLDCKITLELPEIKEYHFQNKFPGNWLQLVSLLENIEERF